MRKDRIMLEKRLVKVSGKYRYDLPGHTEQGLKDYSEVVGHTYGKPGNAIVAVAKLLKKKDPSFDSLKTHEIEVIPERPVVNDDAFEKELADAQPNGPATESTGEDSGTELFK
jgi:hypothetical protein